VSSMVNSKEQAEAMAKSMTKKRINMLRGKGIESNDFCKVQSCQRVGSTFTVSKQVFVESHQTVITKMLNIHATSKSGEQWMDYRMPCWWTITVRLHLVHAILEMPIGIRRNRQM